MKSYASKLLLYYTIKHQGNWEKIFNAIKTKEDVDSEEVENTYNCFEKANAGGFITILDKEYPEQLKQVVKAPLVLFYQGDISLLKNVDGNIAIGCSRHFVKEDDKVINKLFNGVQGNTYVLKDNETDNKFISMVGNKSIVVIGTPLNYKPLPNCDLVLTELPNNAFYENSMTMANRNRIVAGISHKTIILSCEKYSANIILVQFTLSLGHEVMVIPKDIDEEDLSNNQLIYEGATPLYEQKQLLPW